MEAHKFNRLLSRISCDKEAFELLYGEYYLKMKLHIRRRWGNLVAAEDIVQDVREALRTLDETSQKIIYMNIWEGLTFKEIADEMSVSYGSVRTKASRAYKKLRPII